MKYRILIYLLVAAVLLNLAACGASQPTWQEQYELGCKYLSDGNYEEAILAFTAAIEIDPKQILSYMGRAEAFTLAHNNDAAAEDYETVITLDSTYSDAYIKLADLYLSIGDEDTARRILEEGLSQTNDSAFESVLQQLAPDTASPQPAEFIGKTTSDLFAHYGTNYTWDNYAGSTFLMFDDSPLYFFGFCPEHITEDLLIRQIIAFERHVLLENIESGVTYPELAAAVADKVSLAEPEYYYDAMEDRDAYSLAFVYQGYSFHYTWFADPMTAAADSVWLQKLDVPVVP